MLHSALHEPRDRTVRGGARYSHSRVAVVHPEPCRALSSPGKLFDAVIHMVVFRSPFDAWCFVGGGGRSLLAVLMCFPETIPIHQALAEEDGSRCCKC